MEDQSQSELVTDCGEPDLGELFPSFLAGKLTPEERMRIEEHLLRCTRCQAELSFIAKIQEIQKEKVARENKFLLDLIQKLDD